VFGIIAAAGPRPLADYLVLVFAGLALINILLEPVSATTIGPAVAAAGASLVLNSRITAVKGKYKLKRFLSWTRGQIENRNHPGPPRHRRRR
jgi:hypothetical protein